MKYFISLQAFSNKWRILSHNNEIRISWLTPPLRKKHEHLKILVIYSISSALPGFIFFNAATAVSFHETIFIEEIFSVRLWRWSSSKR